MYAIIEDSGSQIKVSKGDVVKVDLRQGDTQPETIVFDRVLLVGGDAPQIGAPYVAGATVTADVVKEDSEKVTIFKFARRKNYRRKIGHRQPFLQVKVTDIQV